MFYKHQKEYCKKSCNEFIVLHILNANSRKQEVVTLLTKRFKTYDTFFSRSVFKKWCEGFLFKRGSRV